MKSHHLLVMLLVAALGALDAAALVTMRLWHADWSEPSAVFLLGLAFGQNSLAAAYLAYGRANVALRGAATIAVAAGMAYLGSQATGSGNDINIWWTIMLVCGVPVVSLAAGMQWFGVRLIHRSDPPGSGRVQFSIWWLLSLTTAAAVAASVARYLKLPPEEFLGVLTFAGLLSLVPAAAAAGVFSGRRTWAILLSICLFPLLGWSLALTGLPPQNDQLALAGMAVVQGLCVLAACAVLRTAGYRFVKL